jgi:hypothetical protein
MESLRNDQPLHLPLNERAPRSTNVGGIGILGDGGEGEVGGEGVGGCEVAFYAEEVEVGGDEEEGLGRGDGGTEESRESLRNEVGGQPYRSKKGEKEKKAHLLSKPLKPLLLFQAHILALEPRPDLPHSPRNLVHHALIRRKCLDLASAVEEGGVEEVGDFGGEGAGKKE